LPPLSLTIGLFVILNKYHKAAVILATAGIKLGKLNHEVSITWLCWNKNIVVLI
jgi:hypothetical protein